MLEDLKMLLDIKDNEQDAKLNYILKTCTKKVLKYCDRDSLLDGMEDLVVEFAILRYNKLGCEGLQEDQYNDAKNVFFASIPPDLQKLLDTYKVGKIKKLRMI